MCLPSKTKMSTCTFISVYLCVYLSLSRLLTLGQRSRGTFMTINYPDSTKSKDNPVFLYIACRKSKNKTQVEEQRVREGVYIVQRQSENKEKQSLKKTRQYEAVCFAHARQIQIELKLFNIQHDCCSARLIGAVQICNTRNISICDPYGATSRCAYKSPSKTQNMLL